MIDAWRSMMDNLSDVYYLVQLIARQIFVYLRDLILREFSWLGTANDDFEATDSKMRNATTRHITADVLAFSVICALLFLLVMLASKCEKDEGQDYASTSVEMMTADLQEDPCYVSRTSSNATNFHACGDSVYLRGRIPKTSPSTLGFPKKQSSVNTSPSRKSLFDQSQHSQSTQTIERVFQRTTQEWLIRRTRSGQIYGKYPA